MRWLLVSDFGLCRACGAAWPSSAAPTIPIPTPSGTRRSSIPPSPRRPRRSTLRSPTAPKSTSSPATSTTRCWNTTTSSDPIGSFRAWPRPCPRPGKCPPAARPIASRSAKASCFTPTPASRLSQSGRQTREVDRRRFRLRAGARGRPRRQQSGDQQLRSDLGPCRLRQAAHRAAPRGRRIRRAAGPRAVRPSRRHCRRRRAWRPRARDRPGRAQCADPLLVRHALHRAGGLGGGGLLQRQGRPPALCRPRRRHRPLPTGSLREAVPLHAGAQRGVVRQPAGQPRRARRRVSRQRSMREDIAEGRIDAAYAGRQMPFVDRIKFYREREDIPRFNKFLQGYYDNGGIIKESFDAVVQGGRLSPEMQARGMRLDKEVEPTIFYVGFNMEDPVLGAAGRRAWPQAAPGHERCGRHQAIPRALPQRPRRAGADAVAAGDLRLRRQLQEPLSPVRCCPRAASSRGGRLQERHRPGHQRAPEAQLRHLGDHGVGEPAVGVPGRGLAPDRPGHRDQRHHLQSIPGQGPARRLSDLRLGLGRRLPRPGEFLFPAGVSAMRAPRAAGRIRPTSAMRSSTGSTTR